MKNTVDFLQILEKEASLQAKLEAKKLLPSQLDAVSSFIGRYTWQVLLFGSGVTALALECLKLWLREGS
ncbi:MAG: hypothetical protein GW946_00710 [Candidatus Pacebacteria bacterium]|nr:hypothetical protein [Candidatus Paceibacterota bacterium]PIR60865.1 MAG: hypothetical protein COU67_00205 [Candidatus Pacebacteria bacterium CG10_big_fil_rev_8_21_14_0_10_44_54]